MRPFEAVLGECVDALLAGATVDECLARYPDRADELEPLLRVGVEVAQNPTPAMPQPAFEYGQQRVRDTVTAMRNGNVTAGESLDGPFPEVIRPPQVQAEEEEPHPRRSFGLVDAAILAAIVIGVIVTFASPFFMDIVSPVAVPTASPTVEVDPSMAPLAVTEPRPSETPTPASVPPAVRPTSMPTSAMPTARPSYELFVGTIDDISEDGSIWVVSGQLIQVTMSTIITGEPAIGRIAHIRADRLEDGTFVAREIQVEELPTPMPGSLTLTVRPGITPPTTPTSTETRLAITPPATPTVTSTPSATVTPTPTVVPTDTRTPAPVPTWTPLPPGEVNPNALVHAVNAQRQLRGLSTLNVHPALMSAAQTHSDDLASNNRWGHVGSDGSRPQGRMARAGYPLGAGEELLASNSTDVEAIVDLWLRNPQDQSILMNSGYVHIGAGYAHNPDSNYRHYWTLLVAVPAAGAPPTETPVPSLAPTSTSTPTLTATATMPTSTPTFTLAPTGTAMFTVIPTRTATPTATPADTPPSSPTPTQTTEPTVAPTPTWTPAPTDTLAPTQTPVPSATPSSTQEPKATDTPAPTSTPTPKVTESPVRTPAPSKTVSDS